MHSCPCFAPPPWCVFNTQYCTTARMSHLGSPLFPLHFQLLFKDAGTPGSSSSASLLLWVLKTMGICSLTAVPAAQTREIIPAGTASLSLLSSHPMAFYSSSASLWIMIQGPLPASLPKTSRKVIHVANRLSLIFGGIFWGSLISTEKVASTSASVLLGL